MFYIQQTCPNGCGYACVNMLLANIRKKKSYLFAPYPEKREMSSFKEIIEYANSYGLILEAVKSENKESLSDGAKVPFIASIEPSDGVHHSVVVTKVTKTSVTYLDPDNGITRTKLTKFINLWDGKSLLVQSDEINDKQFDVIKPIKSKETIFSFIFTLIAGILFLLGMYYVDSNNSSILPCATILVGFTFLIVSRVFSQKALSNIDEAVYYSLKGKANYWNVFERTEAYKKLAFVSPLNLITICLVALFSAFLLIFNDFRNIVLILSSFLFAILDEGLFCNDIKMKSNSLSLKEKQLRYAKNDDDYIAQSRSLHKEASHLLKIATTKDLLFYMCILVLSTALIFVTSQTKVPYLVFYSIFGISLFANFKYMLSYKNKIQESDNLKAKLNNSLNQNI